MRFLSFLLLTLVLSVPATAEQIVMDSQVSITGRNTSDPGPFDVTYTTTFNEDFSTFKIVPSNVESVPTTFPGVFSGVADFMQELDKLRLSDDANDMTITILAPQQDLSTLTFESFESLVASGQLALNYKWYDPTFATNFDAWWEGTVMEPKIENITVVPEPTTLALLGLGLLLVGATRARAQS